MDYRSLHIKTVVELRKLAKELNVRLPAGTSKSNMIEMILEAGARQAEADTSKTDAPAAHAEPEAPAAPRRRGRPRKTPPEASAAVPQPAAESAPADAPAASESGASASAPQTASNPPAIVPGGGTPEPAAESLPAGEAAKPAAPSKAAAEPSKAAAETMPKSAESQHARRAARPADSARPVRVNQQRPVNQNRDRISLRDTRQNAGAYVQRSASENPDQRGEQSQRPNDENDGLYLRRQIPVQPRANLRAASPSGQPSLRRPAARPVQPQPAAEQKPGALPPARAASQPHTPPSAQSQTEYNTINPAVLEMLAAGDCSEGAGVLEIHPEGYGFLRADNYLPGNNDVYVSIAQIHRFGLRTGDYVEGKTRPQREGDRYNAMVYINRVNGLTPDQNARRVPFDSLVPVYPDQRIRLETPDNPDLALRIIDMLAPIGKGQRGMIVSQPKAGKTTLLKKIANSITASHPEIHLIVLLIDERPEEVTDMKRSISGEVVYSTFDEAPENHTRVSEMVLERSQRLVEQGKDVVVLLDSITRLARAYNLVIPPTGRSLSGGLDPGALHKPKRFFGAARNIENGGSLTIIATALVDTGSRMDDIIYEEFKGTGNMELHLDRKLSDRRIFPAIDMYKSGTRREELLLTPTELEGEYQVRKMLGSTNNQETAEQIISMMEKTSCNSDFYARIKGWIAAFEKDGFSMTGSKR